MCLALRSVLCRQEKGTKHISRNPPSNGGGSRHTGIRGAVRGQALTVKSPCYLQCTLKIYNSTSKKPNFKVGKGPNRHVSKDMSVAHGHVDRRPSPVLREMHIHTTREAMSRPRARLDRKDDSSRCWRGRGRARPRSSTGKSTGRASSRRVPHGGLSDPAIATPPGCLPVPRNCTSTHNLTQVWSQPHHSDQPGGGAPQTSPNG